MRSAHFALPVALAALAAAGDADKNATTTVGLFLPGANAAQLVASAVATDFLASTFVVACATNDNACRYPQPFTVIQGPSSVSFHYTNPQETFTSTVACAISASTSAACTVTQEGGNNPGTQTYTPPVSYVPVTVTSGAMFTAAAQAVNGTNGHGNGTVQTGATPTAGGAGSASSAKSTGAAPRMTAFAGLSGAVAAAAMAVAAL